MLYFGLISTKFQEHYSSQLSAGIRAAGLSVPDFNQLGRKGSLHFIQELAAAGGDSSTTTALDLLQRGLKDLTEDLSFYDAVRSEGVETLLMTPTATANPLPTVHSDRSSD